MDQPGPRPAPVKSPIIDRADLQTPAAADPLRRPDVRCSGWSGSTCGCRCSRCWPGRLGLQQAYKYMIVLGGYEEVIGLLGVYTLIILIMGGSLVGWATYNILRYGKLAKRSANQPPTLEEIARHFRPGSAGGRELAARAAPARDARREGRHRRSVECARADEAPAPPCLPAAVSFGARGAARRKTIAPGSMASTCCGSGRSCCWSGAAPAILPGPTWAATGRTTSTTHGSIRRQRTTHRLAPTRPRLAARSAGAAQRRDQQQGHHPHDQRGRQRRHQPARRPVGQHVARAAQVSLHDQARRPLGPRRRDGRPLPGHLRRGLGRGRRLSRAAAPARTSMRASSRTTARSARGQTHRIASGHRDGWPLVAASDRNWLVVWQRYPGLTLHSALVDAAGKVVSAQRQISDGMPLRYAYDVAVRAAARRRTWWRARPAKAGFVVAGRPERGNREDPARAAADGEREPDRSSAGTVPADRASIRSGRAASPSCACPPARSSWRRSSIIRTPGTTRAPPACSWRPDRVLFATLSTAGLRLIPFDLRH